LRMACGSGETPGWRHRQRAPDTAFSRWLKRRPIAAEQPDAVDEGTTPTRRDAKMARLEAVLLVADSALSTRRLSQLATLVDAAEAATLIEALNAAYDAADAAFRVERVATGYRLLTRPRFARWLDRLHQRQSQLKLSPPAMETLTIVAYRQPVTRADIEEIRGVQCAEMLKQLLERNLVRIAGHDESLGRPFLYGTTREFLEMFGLRNLNELPMADRLRRDKPADAETTAAAVADECDGANRASDDVAGALDAVA
jgi:segregation and condensation protein B